MGDKLDLTLREDSLMETSRLTVAAKQSPPNESIYYSKPSESIMANHNH